MEVLQSMFIFVFGLCFVLSALLSVFYLLTWLLAILVVRKQIIEGYSANGWLLYCVSCFLVCVACYIAMDSIQLHGI